MFAAGFFSYEKRFLHKSGRTLWGQLTVALVRDPDDKPSYFVTLVQDTTSGTMLKLPCAKVNIGYGLWWKVYSAHRRF